MSSRSGIDFQQQHHSSRIPFAVIGGDYEVIDQPSQVIKSGLAVYLCVADWWLTFNLQESSGSVTPWGCVTELALNGNRPKSCACALADKEGGPAERKEGAWQQHELRWWIKGLAGGRQKDDRNHLEMIALHLLFHFNHLQHANDTDDSSHFYDDTMSFSSILGHEMQTDEAPQGYWSFVCCCFLSQDNSILK